MHASADISTIELARTKLQLRDDLKFSLQTSAGETYCHVEVTSSSQFYRVGWAEYVFVSLLDGRTTFAEALAVSSQSLGEHALGQQRATSVYSWLLDNGLATLVDADAKSSGATGVARPAKEARSGWKHLNPLWLRIPLGCPEKLLKALQPCFGWLFSPVVAAVEVVLIIAAAVVLNAHWSRFLTDAGGIVSRDNWLWLAIAGIGLKIIHEAGHGLVCLRYGGTVRETGLVLAMLTPLAYVDASSAWSFRSRWQRIHTALAGVQVELLVASLAVLAWNVTDSALARQMLQNVVVMASLSTILFNLNPLMRFDGYFVLSDLMQVPNLSSRASEELSRVIRATLFGDVHSAPALAGARRWLVLGYGVAACIWRLLVSAGLLLTASVLAHGAGLLLAIAGLLMWFGRPVARLVAQLWRMRLQAPERLLRASLITGAMAVAGTAALTGLPAPVMTSAPGIVEFADGEVVRAVTDGFVSAVHVSDGDAVRAGDALLTLTNDEITSELTTAGKRLEQETLRLKSAASDHDGAAASIATGNVASLRKQVDECRKRQDGLTLHATRDGIVTARGLQLLRGTWLKSGAEVLTIGDPRQKEFRVSIGQRDLTASLALVGQSVRVRVGADSALTGTLSEVNPQASRDVPDESLAATNGGPLAVEASTRSDESSSLRLTEHRFTAVVALPVEHADAVFCGQRGQISLGLVHATLGQHVWRTASRWVDEQLSGLQSRL